MLLNPLAPAALAEESTGLVDEMGEMFESAGEKAGSFFANFPRLATQLIMAGAAIFIGLLVIRIGRRMIASIVRKRSSKGMQTVQQVDTLRSLATSVFNYIMYFIIATVVLSLFGVNVSSLLAVAGIGGVAIGFGAQTLVKDIISGLFIWIEGSMEVGDIVQINDLAGSVESIAIRITCLRDFNGNLYVIPNGDIRTVTNISRGFKRAIVDVRCPYEVSQDRIIAILTEEMEIAGREIEGLSEPPEVMSILDFQPDAVIVRIAAACPVKENWRIERDLRLRIKRRFDQEGIEMPHYQRPVVQ